MVQRNDGGPVFPQGRYNGLNRRDYFAAALLGGIGYLPTEDDARENHALLIYGMADAMVEVGAKTLIDEIPPCPAALDDDADCGCTIPDTP